jgi:3-hydroxyacyl-CoA dehydrogenase
MADIKKVAVLGAGVMGQGIAAHLTNAGIDAVLYDMSTEAADKGIATALKAKPKHFMRKGNADRITTAHYDERGAKLLGECDLIIEVVVERLDIKHKVFSWVAEHRRPGSIVASNTSGLSIGDMAEPMPQEMKERFLVMHFFNPVRYMRLLELVAGPETLPEVSAEMAAFGENVLGKGIVWAKDTPNFIANRIGTHGMAVTFHHMADLGLNVAQVDAIFGKAMGRGAGPFRVGDLVGIDTLAHVVKTMYDGLPDDEARDLFVVPGFIQKLIDEGNLGGKTGAGFYKKSRNAEGKKVILARNVETGDYEDQGKPRFKSVGAARKKGIKGLIGGDDVAATAAWRVLRDSWVYCSNRLPEIADDIVNIDRGMKWGYNWKTGPFETWDAAGVAETVARMKEEGISPASWVEEMLEGGRASFYVDGTYWDPTTKTAVAVPMAENWLNLTTVRKSGGLVKKNMVARLLDLGDGVAGLEFNSPATMNALEQGMFELYAEALDELDAGKWEALVVGNQGKAFSAGANVGMILMLAYTSQWDAIDKMVADMQNLLMRAKYSRRPVVTAPYGFTFGGGLEVAMHSSATVAAGETYAGLVEVGVGVLPAGGGCKETIYRFLNDIPTGVEYDPSPYVKAAFKQIALAEVAESAEEAREKGYLRPTDSVCLDPDGLIQAAKDKALGLVQGGYKPPPRKKIKLPGPSCRSAIELFLYGFQEGGFASEHDVLIGKKIANVLTGGDIPTNTWVGEQHLLDLEREGFVSLCGESKTRDRIQYFLENKKPLRN